MRIIVKPLGVTLMVLVLGGSFFAISRGISGAKFPSVGAASHANLAVMERWKFYTENNSIGTMETISASPAGKPLPGIHLSVDSHTDRPWNIGLSNPLKTKFAAGETLKVHFWARAEKEMKVELMMQKNTPGFPDCFRKEYTLGKEWKEYTGSFNTIPMESYESMLAFHCGYDNGWIEIAGVELEH